MPIDSNGNYTLPTTSTAVAGELIEASKHNSTCDDFKQAFNLSLWRDGRAPWTGDHNANGNTIANLKKISDWTTQQAIGASDADARYLKSSGSTLIDGSAAANSSNAAIQNIQVVDYGSGSGGTNTYLQITPPGADSFAVPSLGMVEDKIAAEAQRASTIESNLQSSLNGKQPAGAYVSGQGSGSNPTVSNIQPVNTTAGAETDTSYLQVALTNGKAFPIPTNQNVAAQIKNYVDPKDYISGTAPGIKVQAFTFQITQDSQQVPFPQSFSSIPLAIILTPTTKDLDLGSGDPTTWTKTGFNVTHFGGTLNQIVSVIAVGVG
ncbi:MAG: hypothetical protein ABF968_04770 [Acetobacter sp.]|uniref:hypothetical protein n=1 Tax=Acetobacter sp. TaxID=440 RepID=UPI0039ECA731